MFKQITNLTTGEVTVGTQMGSFLVTEDDTFTRCGSFLTNTRGDTLVKAGSNWMDTTGNLHRIGSVFDDDSY